MILRANSQGVVAKVTIATARSVNCVLEDNRKLLHFRKKTPEIPLLKSNGTEIPGKALKKKKWVKLARLPSLLQTVENVVLFVIANFRKCKSET